MDFFKDFVLADIDPIFGISWTFAEDKRSNKLNASIGTYRGDDLKPYILPSVKKAEAALLETEKSKEYLFIIGDQEYCQLTKKIVFGEVDLTHIAAIQTLGGTGALRLAGDLLRLAGVKQLYLGDPTWANHLAIFTKAGFKITRFPHFDTPNQLKAMERGSVVVLQASCHNPTGCDPDFEEWKLILKNVQERELFVIFDLAYQGFGEGFSEDVAPIRLFAEKEIPFAVAVSHSKNFGLYAERTGALFVACKEEKQADIVASQLGIFVRTSYSNPPCHGSHIVKMILQTPSLRKQWEKEVEQMRQRIVQMRHLLASELEAATVKTPSRFKGLALQKGMFAFPRIDSIHVQKLKEKYAIYLTGDGRINLAGLNAAAVTRLARALAAVDLEV